jgi:hypothetical protein
MPLNIQIFSLTLDTKFVDYSYISLPGECNFYKISLCMSFSGNYFCYKFYLVITVREKWQPNEPNVLVNLVKHTGQMAEAKCIAGESASTMSNI